jgi:hypothetical protein
MVEYDRGATFGSQSRSSHVYCDQVLSWLLAGFRWLGEHFPDQAQLYPRALSAMRGSA